MASEWKSVPAAVEHVVRLLKRAGTPLELDIASIAESFCGEHDDPQNTSCSAGHIVYADDTADPMYREVDQQVTFYEEFELDSRSGIQLVTTVLIEGKHRIDVEYFAFPSPSKDMVTFPLFSNLCGSQLSRLLLAGVADPALTFPPARLAAVTIESGRTPRTIVGEDIAYKAAGALYDFVLFDTRDYGDTESTGEIINTAFTDFKDYIEKNHYDWWSVYRSWVSKIDQTTVDAYNGYVAGDRPVYYGLSAYCPVICVNGALHAVKWDSANGITGFDSCPCCTVILRKSGWPGSGQIALLTRNREVPVLLTTQEGLPAALGAALEWHSSLRTRLTDTERPVIDRWLFEAALYRKVVRYFAKHDPERGYRSDFDYRHWL